ncbi:MAG: hypothetical protein AAF703_07030 [Cyanobacteria bacterium P01_D01_bin.105]
MARHFNISKKILSLLGLAVAAPMAFSTAASAQLMRVDASPQIELKPNCEVVDCNTLPRIEIPPQVIPFPCDPRVCDPVEFESFERIELERLSKPALEEIIRRGNLQGAGRIQKHQSFLKFDE